MTYGEILTRIGIDFSYSLQTTMAREKKTNRANPILKSWGKKRNKGHTDHLICAIPTWYFYFYCFCLPFCLSFPAFAGPLACSKRGLIQSCEAGSVWLQTAPNWNKEMEGFCQDHCLHRPREPVQTKMSQSVKHAFRATRKDVWIILRQRVW